MEEGEDFDMTFDTGSSGVGVGRNVGVQGRCVSEGQKALNLILLLREIVQLLTGMLVI